MQKLKLNRLHSQFSFRLDEAQGSEECVVEGLICKAERQIGDRERRRDPYVTEMAVEQLR
jgi:hypothetical protein